MSQGKPRNVYIVEPVLLDQSGVAQGITPGFWEALHVQVAGLAVRQRLITYRSRRYRGAARTCASPAVDYLYLGKRRPGVDWPDTADGDADEEPLSLPGDLVEPLYLTPVSGTNYSAVMRSSAGPTFQAFEAWVDQVLQLHQTNWSFRLRPYVRRDDIERLRSATGVSKFSIKYDPGALDDVQPVGEISSALKAVQRSGAGGVSVAVEVSFGHATPDETASRLYAEEIDALLEIGGVKKASATLLHVNQENQLSRDYVEFLNDRVVYTVSVGDSEAERQTPSVVLAGMGEAIQRFRSLLADGER